MAKRTMNGAHAVVTGASSGIGQALAHELACQGAKLLLTARRADRLEQLCATLSESGCEAHYVAGDITQGEVRGRIFEEIGSRWGTLDALVNNAGVGAIGPFVEADAARLRRIMEVNFFAPLEMIREAIPLLARADGPIIVNVGSVLGHRAVPLKSEYCASKFALHGFSDALRAELASRGVDVLLVSPSTTASEFFDNVLENRATLPWTSWGAMSPRAVAKKTVCAMCRGSHEIILSPGGKLLVWLDRLCPTLINRLTARFGQG